MRIGNSIIAANKWAVTPTADKLDVTNFEGSGFAIYIPGIFQADFTIEGHWDSANNEFSDPLNFVVGAYILAVKLFTNDLASPFWYFPIALVLETPMTAAVRETITFTLSCTACGSYVYPGSTTPPASTNGVGFPLGF